MTFKTCTWRNDAETEDARETDCGNMFVLNDGTPEDNHMKFCCYCGRQLVTHALANIGNQHDNHN